MRWKHLLKLLAYTIHGPANAFKVSSMCRSPPIESSPSFALLLRGQRNVSTWSCVGNTKADAIGNRVGIAGIEAAVIPNPEEICPKMRLRILALH